MKKILIIFVILLLFTSQIYAASDVNYDKYKTNVEKNCKNYEIENNVVINIDEYKSAWSYQLMNKLNPDYAITKAVDKYKTDMNSIYKCAVIDSQKNSLNIISTKLPNSSSVKEQINQSIEKQKSKLDIQFKDAWCANIDKYIVIKKNILDQTTYETCRYSYYMDYLKTYYDDFSKTATTWDTTPKSIEYYVSYQNTYTSRIDYEIQRAYDVFPIAYHAYTEYENNFPIHLLLEVIKQDFIVLREKFYEVISPINQVVYKISNAMSK